MSFSLFTLGKKTEEVSLMIDVGNGSIGGGMVRTSPGQAPLLLHSVRVPFSIGDKVDSDRLLQNFQTLLNDLLKALSEQGFLHEYWKKHPKRISQALVTFSSPWFVGKTVQIDLAQDKIFVITENFLKDVLEKEEKTFKEELGKSGYEQTFDNELEVIEKSIVHGRINGYVVSDIIGKKTKHLEASVCLSIIARSITDVVAKNLSKHFHVDREDITFHSFPLVAFTVIRDIFPRFNDFILLDITGETTDVTLVRQDVIVKTVSFPSGRNFIIRHIAKTCGVTLEIAESLLRLQQKQALEAALSEQVANVIRDVQKEWMIYLSDSFIELSPSDPTPSRVFLTADTDVADIYLGFLKEGMGESGLRRLPDTVHLNAETLAHFYHTDPRRTQDEFIGILSVFWNKMTR